MVTDIDQSTVRDFSDAKIVEMTLEDKRHFEVLIIRYQEKLSRYIARQTNISLEDREDLLQDIFVKVYQNINSYNSDLSFSSWIYRVAHNQIISTWRKHKVRPEGNSAYVEPEYLYSIPDEHDFLSEIDQELASKELYKIIQGLNNKYREILILHFFENKSYEEISDILKLPPGTVATRISRAKKSLRKEVDKDTTTRSASLITEEL